MPPNLAFFLCLIFIFSILNFDAKQKNGVSRCIWIPVVWMFIIATRNINIWYNQLFGGQANVIDSIQAYHEGSPLDRIFLSFFILIGISVLTKRKDVLRLLIKYNFWIIIFFFFGAVSFIWSDFPLVAIKRWLRAIGSIIMIMVILTESDSIIGFKIALKRCSYVFIPLSVLLIKYYPHLGRGFSHWTGEGYNMGVAADKNMLGNFCFISGLLFVMEIIEMYKRKLIGKEKLQFSIYSFYLVLIFWLIHIADSATSLVCFYLGLFFLLFTKLKFFRKSQRTIDYIIVFSLIIGVIGFGIFDLFVPMTTALGRDATLTGRTEVWETLLSMEINPVLGEGFENFWLADRLKYLWDIYWWHPNQAHNGYLETYLNLGFVGLFLLVGIIFNAYRKAKVTMLKDIDFGCLKIIYLLLFLIYNITDASFHTKNIVGFVFFMVAFDFSKTKRI